MLISARTVRRLSEMRGFVAVFVIAFYLIGFIIRRTDSFVKRNFKIYCRLFCGPSLAKGDELCYYKRGKGDTDKQLLRHGRAVPPPLAQGRLTLRGGHGLGMTPSLV